MAKVLTPPPRPTEPLLPCCSFDRVECDAFERDLLRVATAAVVGIVLGLLLGFAVWGVR